MSIFKVEPENNCLNRLEKKIGKTLGFKITAEKKDMSKVEKIIFSGLDNISDPEYQFTSRSSIKMGIKSRNGEITFTRQKDEMPIELIFEFKGVYLNPLITLAKEEVITIKVNGAKDVELASLTGIVYIQEDTPTIDYFHINPSLLFKKGVVKLSWKCRNIDAYSIHYADGTIPPGDLPDIKDGVCNFEEFEITLPDTFKDETLIHLVASKGEMVAQKNNRRKVHMVPNNYWNTITLSETISEVKYENNIYDIINNEYDDKIWALAKRKENSSIRLWCSVDGMNWEPAGDEQIGVIIGEQELHRPAVFFSPTNLEDAQLYFVGGSTIDIGKTSNEVVCYSLASPKSNQRIRQEILKNNSNWKARMGHACVVFPDPNFHNDNIWIIGGADSYGNGLKDIWRWDGIQWWEETTPRNFPKRCQFTTTVLKNHSTPEDCTKMEIWIAGGEVNYQGDPVRDIWRYFNNGKEWMWQQVYDFNSKAPLSVFSEGKWLCTCGLTSLRGRIICTRVVSDQIQNSQWIEQKGVKEIGDENIICYAFGNNKIAESGGWANETRSGQDMKHYQIKTIGFNGGVWLIAKRYYKKDDIGLSNLYYLVPEQLK